jgi:hypothetical protein
MPDRPGSASDSPWGMTGRSGGTPGAIGMAGRGAGAAGRVTGAAGRLRGGWLPSLLIQTSCRQFTAKRSARRDVLLGNVAREQYRGSRCVRSTSPAGFEWSGVNGRHKRPFDTHARSGCQGPRSM